MVLLRKSHLSYRRHFKTQTSSLYEKKNAVFCLQPFSFHRYSSFKICKKWGWSYISILVCFRNWIQPFLKPLQLEVVVHGVVWISAVSSLYPEWKRRLKFRLYMVWFWLIRRSGEGRGREVFSYRRHIGKREDPGDEVVSVWSPAPLFVNGRAPVDILVLEGRWHSGLCVNSKQTTVSFQWYVPRIPLWRLKTVFRLIFADLWPPLHLQTHTRQHLISHEKLALCNIGRHMSNGVAQEKVER